MTHFLIARGAGATSTGKIRTTNEDRYLVDEAGSWFAVADGVGGLPYGEKASECAIRTLVREVGAQSREPDMAGLIARCHHAVGQLGQVLESRLGIGTTFTCFHLFENTGFVGHVGDCAAYLQSDRSAPLLRLTEAHTTLAPPVFMAGTAAPFTAPPCLARYLGQHNALVGDAHRFALAAGNRLILCSDGITRALDERDLVSLSSAQPTPAGLAHALVHVADLRGGVDNATAVVIDITCHPRSHLRRKP